MAELFDRERKKGLTEAEIGKRYGRSQQWVSEYLNIRKYSDQMKQLLTSRLVTLEHARAIVSMVKDPRLQVQISKKVVKERLSVRETKVAIRTILKRNTQQPIEGRRDPAESTSLSATSIQPKTASPETGEVRKNKLRYTIGNTE